MLFAKINKKIEPFVRGGNDSDSMSRCKEIRIQAQRPFKNQISTQINNFGNNYFKLITCKTEFALLVPLGRSPPNHVTCQKSTHIIIHNNFIRIITRKNWQDQGNFHQRIGRLKISCRILVSIRGHDFLNEDDFIQFVEAVVIII